MIRGHRRRALGLACALLVVILGGCAKSDDGPAAPSGQSSASTTVDVAASKFTDLTGNEAQAPIAVVDNEFEPIYATVKAGAKVIWTNNGRNKHNIVPSVKGAFDGTKNLPPGQAFSVTFDKPGDYPYYCSIHGSPRSGQNGVIRVVG